MTARGLPVSTRLTALLFAAIFVPTVAMLGFMHLASARALAGQEKQLVEEMRVELLAEYESAGPQGLVEAIQDRLEFDPRGDEVLSYADPFGRTFAGNIAGWPPDARQGLFRTALRRADDRTDKPVLLDTIVLPDNTRLLVGHVTAGGAALAIANRAGLLLAVLIAAPLSLALAFLLLRIIERRAGNIAAIAEGFGAGDFTRRVPEDGNDDAFDRLSRALNAMLDRIETLVGELRLVTDGLAHDLRSPVTRLQTAIEEAVATRSDETAAEALRRAADEAAALQAMLSTALQISRAEAGIGRNRFARTNIATILGDLTEIYGPLAEERGFTLNCEAPEMLDAKVHRELLTQALGNLVENAINYAAGGTTIALSAKAESGRIVFTVADDGPGIPPDRRAEALRRFGRLDPARGIPGTGLGMSLAEATARLHGGTLTLEENRPGLKVVLTLLGPDAASGPDHAAGVLRRVDPD